MLDFARKFLAPEPTVFHITHWKAGSQWIHKILREVAYQEPSLQVVAPTVPPLSLSKKQTTRLAHPAYLVFARK